jgi:hypothetical protein
MVGRARHKQMAQLIVDHDGDLSSLRIGDDGTGGAHFDRRVASWRPNAASKTTS